MTEHPEAHEVVLGRAALTLTTLLDQQMDAIFARSLEEVQEPQPIQRQRAAAANRIVLICRSLADELRRYEHLQWMVDNADDDQNADRLNF